MIKLQSKEKKMPIEQIKENFFEEFDNASGEERIKTMDRLMIQYAHKIREMITIVNELSEKNKNSWWH
jgi:phosphoenolpyruvate carboxylase